MAVRSQPNHWEIQGTHVPLPVQINDASFVGAVYRPSRRAVDHQVEDLGLRASGWRGTGLGLLMFVQYRDFALGAYDEVGLAVLAAPPGGRPGLVTLELPVTQGFTLEAGREIWGLPKWLMQSSLDVGGQRSHVRVDVDDAPVVEGVLTAGRRRLPLRAPFVTPTWARAEDGPFAGQLLRGKASMRATGLRVARGGTALTWGDHPMADRARALGMDEVASMTFAAEKLTGSLGESRVMD